MTASRDIMPDQKGDAGQSILKGTATLNGLSTVNVPCPQVTAQSIILTSIQTPNGSVGLFWVSSRTPGTGFSLVSVALNSSVVGWAVMEP